MQAVILDASVFVALACKRQNASARIIEAIRTRSLVPVWDDVTQRETRNVLIRIPPTSWDSFADLFFEPHRWTTSTNLAGVDFMTNRQDRNFAALSMASGAVLISGDSDLLNHAYKLDVFAPSEFLKRDCEEA